MATNTEKAKIRPLTTPKHLNRSSPKLACKIMSSMAPGMQNFVAIGPGVSAPQIRVLMIFRAFCVTIVRFWALQ